MAPRYGRATKIKNPNPGYATERQVRKIFDILIEAGMSPPDDFGDLLMGLTQDQIKKVTDRAYVTRFEKTGMPIPVWVKL